MEVPISYFDPDNGQSRNIEQRINDLFANGVSEITVSELGVTYTKDPSDVSELLNELTEYFKIMSAQEQDEAKVSASDAVSEVSVDVSLESTGPELVRNESRISTYASLSYVIGFILGIISIILGASTLEYDIASGVYSLVGGVIIIITAVVIGNTLSFIVALSAKIRALENKINIGDSGDGTC